MQLHCRDCKVFVRDKSESWRDKAIPYNSQAIKEDTSSTIRYQGFPSDQAFPTPLHDVYNILLPRERPSGVNQQGNCSDATQVGQHSPNRLGCPALYRSVCIQTAYKVVTSHFPFQLVYGLTLLMPTDYVIPTLRSTRHLNFTPKHVLTARVVDLKKLDETRQSTTVQHRKMSWNTTQWARTQGLTTQ